MTSLPLAATEDQRELWKRLQPVFRVAATDTYKRTMSGSSVLFAENWSCYTLAARKALSEEGADGRYIMAGLEKMLYPWFMEPISSEEVARAQTFFHTHASVRRFPDKLWQVVIDNDGYLPIDIYALPGGQTFLAKNGKYVPFASIEGPGGLVSHLEPHLENMYAPIIQATKARLFREQTGSQFAEFGLRSDQNENNHITLMLALYVGGGFSLTSDDQAVMLFPEYFQDIGTIGHEFIMAYQRRGLTLEQAQEQAFREFVAANQRSALLPDVIDTISSGLPAILRLVKEYQHTDKIIMPRFDSGDVALQCILWKRMTLDAGIPSTKMVVEDGYTPKKAQETKALYAAAGFNPDDIIVGAGGYFQDGCERDVASLVDKRSATYHGTRLESSMKFSNSPGKESIPGRVRVYAQGRVLVVAQEDEMVDGIPLMQKVVDNGRICYAENLQLQWQRTQQTWDSYDSIEYSPATENLMDTRRQELATLFSVSSKCKDYNNFGGTPP